MPMSAKSIPIGPKRKHGRPRHALRVVLDRGVKKHGSPVGIEHHGKMTPWYHDTMV